MTEELNQLAKDDPALAEALAGAAQAPAETQEPVVAETVEDDPALVAALSGTAETQEPVVDPLADDQSKPELEVGGAGLLDPEALVTEFGADILANEALDDAALDDEEYENAVTFSAGSESNASSVREQQLRDRQAEIAKAEEELKRDRASQQARSAGLNAGRKSHKQLSEEGPINIGGRRQPHRTES